MIKIWSQNSYKVSSENAVMEMAFFMFQKNVLLKYLMFLTVLFIPVVQKIIEFMFLIKMSNKYFD